jgi:hypothetical protein
MNVKRDNPSRAKGHVASLTNKEMRECGECEQYSKDEGCIEEDLLKSPARMKTGTEIISSECASE